MFFPSVQLRDLDNLVADVERSFTDGMTHRSGAHPRSITRLRAVQLWLAACAALIGAAFVPMASASTAGGLTFRAEVEIFYPPTSCPPGAPDGVTCFVRTGRTLVRGLGKLEESYAYILDEHPAGCPEEHVRGLPSTARLTVPGKGTIDVRVNGTDCLARIPPAPVIGTETFVVIGGSGTYAGASGSGTIDHVSNGPPAWRGKDTWTGTLVVPGLEFDLTPPVISGAVSKRSRAPRKARQVRVGFKVTARDEVDGPLSVVCTPKSGSRFRIGRTTVRCSATDSSANRSIARFTITVVPARRIR